MTLYAKIENDVVTNLARGDASWAAAAPGTWVAAPGAQVGFAYDPVAGAVTIPEAPSPEPATDAERAASLSLKSADFYTALRANALIDFSDIGATETTRQWVLGKIAASALPAATKIVALDRAETASVFHRSDPEVPGMMEAVGAILPRADGEAGGLPSAEIDAMFLGVA